MSKNVENFKIILILEGWLINDNLKTIILGKKEIKEKKNKDLTITLGKNIP